MVNMFSIDPDEWQWGENSSFVTHFNFSRMKNCSIAIHQYLWHGPFIKLPLNPFFRHVTWRITLNIRLKLPCAIKMKYLFNRNYLLKYWLTYFEIFGFINGQYHSGWKIKKDRCQCQNIVRNEIGFTYHNTINVEMKSTRGHHNHWVQQGWKQDANN